MKIFLNRKYVLILLAFAYIPKATSDEANPAHILADNEYLHCIKPVAKNKREIATEVWCALEDGSSNPSMWFKVNGKSNLTFMPWLSEGQAVDGLSVSGSGKYLAVVHIGEGHPYLIIYDIDEARHGSDTMRVFTFNPYPGYVKIYRWDNDTLLFESDYQISQSFNNLMKEPIIYSINPVNKKPKPVGKLIDN